MPRGVVLPAVVSGDICGAVRRPTSDGGTISLLGTLYTISGADPRPADRDVPFVSTPKAPARARIGVSTEKVVFGDID